MGLIDGVFGLLFGGGRNVVAETAKVFREGSDGAAERAVAIQSQAMVQHGAEFQGARQGWFDRFVDGLNRLPRPLMALGVIALFISAMSSPLWFAERMQGIALVPEPLWWLLGVIVSFYFGARHQVKAQDFQREIAQSMGRVPQVLDNIQAIRALRHDTPGVAETGSDAELSIATLEPTENPAIEAWRKTT